jgi:hypothetical protein
MHFISTLRKAHADRISFDTLSAIVASLLLISPSQRVS